MKLRFFQSKNVVPWKIDKSIFFIRILDQLGSILGVIICVNFTVNIWERQFNFLVIISLTKQLFYISVCPFLCCFYLDHWNYYFFNQNNKSDKRKCLSLILAPARGSNPVGSYPVSVLFLQGFSKLFYETELLAVQFHYEK